jgi:hypothetical protein
MSKLLRKQPVYETNFFMRGTITVRRTIRNPKMKKPNSHGRNDIVDETEPIVFAYADKRKMAA